MRQVKLSHLYHYKSLRKEIYFIRIFGAPHNGYRVNFYNIKSKKTGHKDVTQTCLDFVFNSSMFIIREPNKEEKAKALLLGL